MRVFAVLVLVTAAWSHAVMAEDSARQDHPVDVIVDADNAQLELDRQIFCRKMKFAGSHLKRRVCLPRGQWEKMNWTPRRQKQPKLYEEDPSEGDPEADR